MRAGLIVAAALACPLPALAQERAEGDFFLGVQTHFVQGWRLEFMDLLPELGAPALRDELSWPRVERGREQYDFSGERAQYLPLAIAQDIDPLVLFTDTNPRYDGGQTPYTPEAQSAMARYVAATLDAHAPGLRRIEIGNEFNSDDFVSGPFREDRARHFAAMLRAVYDEVKPRHPKAEILCTGMHSVAMGFFRELFEQGMLGACDAISLHLYRDEPEGLGDEIARLRALMAEFGPVLPIYVTEFGKWFDDPGEAPDFMLKSVALMSAAGIAGAWWYALLDQPFWPNMGLFRPDPTEPMPAADSFALLQREVLPLGRAVHVGDTLSDQVYAFGTPARAVIAWGAPGELEVSGTSAYLDARGKPIAPVRALLHAPVVILGEDVQVKVRRDHAVADTRYSFGHAPWSYHALRPDGRESALEHIDWEWSSFLGDPFLRPLLVSQDWVSGVRFATGDYQAIERFTASEAGAHGIEGVWHVPEGEALAGAVIRILHNGAEIGGGVVQDGAYRFGPVTLQLAAGDRIDFAVGPGLRDGNHAVRRQITIRAPGGG